MMLHRLHRTLSDLKVVGNLSDFPRNHILASEFLIPRHLVLPPWNLKGKPLNLKTKTTQNSYFYFLASFGTEQENYNNVTLWGQEDPQVFVRKSLEATTLKGFCSVGILKFSQRHKVPSGEFGRIWELRS